MREATWSPPPRTASLHITMSKTNFYFVQHYENQFFLSRHLTLLSGLVLHVTSGVDVGGFVGHVGNMLSPHRKISWNVFFFIKPLWVFIPQERELRSFSVPSIS